MGTKEDLQGFLATAYCDATDFQRKLEEENGVIEDRGANDYTVVRVRKLLRERIEKLTGLLDKLTEKGFGHVFQH